MMARRSPHNLNFDNGNLKWLEIRKRFNLSPLISSQENLQWEGRRWHNLNIAIPLYLPDGAVVITDKSSGANTYAFPPEMTSAKQLFSSSGNICNQWASKLRLRLAVIHKCPSLMVPKLAQAFNAFMSDFKPADEPIEFTCQGIARHNIRIAAGSTFRYDTLASTSTDKDASLLNQIIDRLHTFQCFVNGAFRQECHALADALDELPTNYDKPNNRPNSHRDIEFRFSPCNALKVIVREGISSLDESLEEQIVGGGLNRMSPWAKSIIVRSVMGSELRVERDKGVVDVVDQSPYSGVKGTMVNPTIKDNSGNLAAVAICPKCTRIPLVVSAGSKPLESIVSKLFGKSYEESTKEKDPTEVDNSILSSHPIPVIHDHMNVDKAQPPFVSLVDEIIALVENSNSSPSPLLVTLDSMNESQDNWNHPANTMTFSPAYPTSTSSMLDVTPTPAVASMNIPSTSPLPPCPQNMYSRATPPGLSWNYPSLTEFQNTPSEECPKAPEEELPQHPLVYASRQ